MKLVLFFSFFYRCRHRWFYWIMKYAGRIGTRMAKNWDNWKLLVAVLQPSSWHTQWNIWTWWVPARLKQVLPVVYSELFGTHPQPRTILNSSSTNWYVFLQIVAFGSPPSSTVYFSFSCSSNKWVISADFWSQSTKAILKLEKGSPHLGSCLELHSQHLIAEPYKDKSHFS